MWPSWQIWTLRERVMHSGKSCVGVQLEKKPRCTVWTVILIILLKFVQSILRLRLLSTWFQIQMASKEFPKQFWPSNLPVKIYQYFCWLKSFTGKFAGTFYGKYMGPLVCLIFWDRNSKWLTVQVVLESRFSVGTYVDYSKLMNCVWNFNLDMAVHDTWKNEMKSQRVFSDKTVSS